jgi:hypothetical protein
MEKSESKRTYGTWSGFLGMLQVALIVLRLCDVIGWRWWWVLAPLWVSFACSFVVGIIAGLMGKDDQDE